PEPFTDARLGDSELHVTAWPDRTFPPWSRAVALSATVFPCTTDAPAGEIDTDAASTTFTTVTAVPGMVSLVAVMVAVPGPTAVTPPLPFTVATAVLPLPHVTTRPVRTFPPASFVVAES